MYQENPACEKPEDENVKIWRYLDFTNFVSLLDKGALFFVRADRLLDKFEGSYPKLNIDLRPVKIKMAGFPEKAIKQFQNQLPEIHKQFRRYAIINCWHIN